MLAVGYRNGDQVFGRPTEQVWGDDGPYWHLQANGGLLASAADMLRWDAALHGDEILDARAKDLLFGRHVSEQAGLGTCYGYGWSVFATTAGKTVVTHNGGNGVFFADFYRLVDDDAAVFIATNSDRWEASDIGHWLASFLANGSRVRPQPGHPGRRQ